MGCWIRHLRNSGQTILPYFSGEICTFQLVSLIKLIVSLHFTVFGRQEAFVLHLGHAIQAEENLQMSGNFSHLYDCVFVRKLRFQWLSEIRTGSDSRGKFTS